MLDGFPVERFSGHDSVGEKVFVVGEDKVEAGPIFSPAHDFRQDADGAIGMMDSAVLLLESHLDQVPGAQRSLVRRKSPVALISPT